jgi:serine/threonine-protein kinase
VAGGATGVLLLPVAAPTVSAIATGDTVSVESEQARVRSLLAVSLLDEDPLAPLTAIAGAFAADDCVIWWRDGDSMAPRGASNLPEEAYRGAVAAAARISTATGATTIVNGPSGPRSVIAAPLRSAPHEVAGLIAIVADRPRRFTPAERTDLRALAVRLTRELQHLAGYRRLVAEDEKLRAGSVHDPLTSALTRSAFEQAVGNEVAAAARRGESLSLVFLDVVGLRKINLAYGHRTGDEVLVQIANRIRAAVRGTDLLGRFGGDELALLLINAAGDQARLVCDKVLERIVATPLAIGAEVVPIAMRCVLTPIGPGERTGEAGFARAIGALRAAPPDTVTLVPIGAGTPDGEGHLEASALGVGTTVGGTYRILHELSRGAMGVVYRGEDIGLGRPVAIKVLRSDLASDAELVSRFRAEAAMLASLHHPNLVQVYALGEHAGEVYFVMELVEGQPISEVLRAAIDRGEWLPAPAIAQIVVEIADALDAMHQVGLIHRDVKPGNILLDRDKGRAVLVDVGVATKSGNRGEGAGTPGFAAPESFVPVAGPGGTGSEVGETAATDVYGLAATVYAMLTGRTPYGSGQVMAVLSRQLNEPLTPPSRQRPTLSSAVDEVLIKALDPMPKRRWASANAFAVALGSALERVKEDTGDRPAVVVEAPARRAEAPAEKAVAMLTEVLPAAVMPVVAPSEPPRTHPASDGTLHGEIRGAHFRVAARGITSRLGVAALRQLVEASPQLARVLSPTLPAIGWEPVEIFLELLDRASARMDADEMARMIGRATIQATFARFFGANPASLPIETVMRAAPAFWGRYHTWSRLTIALSAPHHTELILDHSVALAPMCAMAGAQLARVAELSGGREVTLDHTTCAARGDAECRFVVTWST